MKKNVLVISSSPRKGGNSDVLCDQFILGAQSKGHHVEKVFLADLEIKFCTGCGYCNEHHRCVLKDDMEQLLNKMVKCDVILLSTPVYFYSMCAQLKVMIDRICPRYQEISNKDFYFIATAADASSHALNTTIAGFNGLLDCLINPQLCGILHGVGVWQKDDVKSTPLMQDAFLLGQSVL